MSIDTKWISSQLIEGLPRARNAYTGLIDGRIGLIGSTDINHQILRQYLLDCASLYGINLAFELPLEDETIFNEVVSRVQSLMATDFSNMSPAKAWEQATGELVEMGFSQQVPIHYLEQFMSEDQLLPQMTLEMLQRHLGMFLLNLQTSYLSRKIWRADKKSQHALWEKITSEFETMIANRTPEKSRAQSEVFMRRASTTPGFSKKVSK